MTILKVLLAMFLVLSQARVSGPIVVGGGAGGSEFSLVFTRANLKSILSDCLQYSCGFSAAKAQSLRPLLVQAMAVLPAIFKSSAQVSGLYEVRTGEVVFNKDLLWLDPAHKVPYEISDAIKLWLEIINAGGAISTVDLNELQTRIAKALQIEKTEQAYGADNSFSVLLWKVSPTYDRLYVSSSSEDTFELTGAIAEKIGCSGLTSLKFQSPSWRSATPRPTQLDPDEIILKLSLNTNWSCAKGAHIGVGSATISVKKNKSGRLQFDPTTLDIYIGEI